MGKEVKGGRELRIASPLQRVGDALRGRFPLALSSGTEASETEEARAETSAVGWLGRGASLFVEDGGWRTEGGGRTWREGRG